MSTGTLPETMVMASTCTSGQRRAMIRATASSEAVSVSMRKRRVGAGACALLNEGAASAATVERKCRRCMILVAYLLRCFPTLEEQNMDGMNRRTFGRSLATGLAMFQATGRAQAREAVQHT